jgi:hypothetical protein
MGETVRIEILQLPAGNVVAREIQTRGPEGKFHLRLSGQVAYRPPDDGKEWPAGQSIEVFVAAAEAWNKYCDDVITAKTDQDELAIVDRLRTRLNELDLLQDAETGYWALVLTQAQDGLL